MTEDEFWKHLEGMKGKFRKSGWCIRSVTGDKCPICAVAESVTSERYANNTMAIRAASDIGLDPQFTDAVIVSADRPLDRLCHRDLDAVRRRLEAIVA